MLLSRGRALWNMYGPTETTIWSCGCKVERGAGAVPVGRPIANTTTYILNSAGAPVPIGIPGELYIGGDGLARGYRNREDLTKERFTVVEAAEAERLYRTGDIARYRADGAIEWLGRTDNQVKIRGHRVELEEIEAALLSHDAIAAAAARTWPDSAGLPSLTGYFVSRGTTSLDLIALREYLRGRLPDHMVPARLMPIATLPLTLNGKIDRKALPKPEMAAGVCERADPESKVERHVAAIWQDVLGTSHVGAEDDFFALGGHSLLATTVLRRIELELGVALPLAAMFRSPTVRRLAAMIEEAPRSAAAAHRLPSNRRISPFMLSPNRAPVAPDR
jgi:hypothetical protein